ncbi:SusC/RagA family TonB-linked outer membrane protein [Algoriphagus sp.]|uniref:SusC/RagA family TonB-linked outer membrane protein n=1 Tax=Algoriphagus sp. TaxID=1872435 RepID=UPI00263251BD|nr:SusC/RagA family TonB-linked outer membrane protein [Algoriphagus sp.]
MKKVILFHVWAMSKKILQVFLIQCLSMSVLFANSGNAQIKTIDQVELTLNLSNAGLLEAFNRIEHATGFNFVYTNKELKNVPQVNLKANSNVYDALVEISKQTGLNFKQVNGNIHVRRNSTAQASQSVVIEEQEDVAVSGVVYDDTGVALPGASVIEKGTTNGTVTDLDGSFSLTVSSSESVLVVSFIGMLTQEITVGQQSEFTINLEQDTKSLEEVVVIGYGTQKRREITSSVAKVNEESFNSGGVRSPLDLIQGKVAGLSITRTEGNNPNSGAAIQLRGVTSLTGNLSPLIVIDGIPGGSLDLLQQDDIASFDVLKDGSAAAIYGTRGNNGVILITTKKGKAGDPRFEYSTYFQRDVVDRKPDFLTAEEYRDLIDQGLIGEGNDLGASTDLYDELLNKQNFSQYHNFAASGGTLNSNYRASFYFNDAEGMAKENSRRQFGGRINFNQTGLEGRLQMQSNLATNFNLANLLGGGGTDFEQAIQRNPTAPIRDENGEFVETEAFNNYNPLSRLQHRINERNQATFSGDTRFTFEIIEGLTVSAFGAHVRNTFNDRQYRSLLDFAQRPNAQYQGTGYARKYNELTWTNVFESTVNYKRNFGDHAFDFIGGYSYQYSTYENFAVNNNGFTTDAFLDWNLGAGSAINNTLLPRPGMGSFKDDNTLIALFGRVSYSFNEKYFGQVTFRREGSSKFGANNKWGNFPAFSAGWDLSKEDFLSGISQIDNLKLRVGYGVTGNQGIPNYQSLVTLSTGGVYPQEGIFYQTYGPSRNPNPDLRWEKKQEWNIGLDFGVFNNRLTGSLDIYQRNTVDLLNNYTAQQPPFVRSSIYTNVGSIKNKGVELYLNGVIVEKEGFRYSVDFAANSQFNELSTLSNEFYSADFLEYGFLPSPGNLGAAIRLEEGGKVGNFYGKRFAGFDEDGKWLFFNADGDAVSASEITPGDLTVIGNGVPKYMASLSNNISYKNWDFTVFFRGKFGYDILNTQDLYFGNKAWLPNNLLSSAITKNAELDDNPQFSDYYLENGSFVKLDNVTIGYNFDVSGKAVKNLRVYATGRNLLTFTGYSGLDPELQDTGFTTGIDNRGFYPRTNSYTLGLNITF